MNFVEFLKDRNIAHIGVDTDNEDSTLRRVHPDVEFLDFRDEKNLDAIFTSVKKADLVFVDAMRPGQVPWTHHRNTPYVSSPLLYENRL